MSYHIAQGDVLTTLRQIPDNTFHGVLTDPPYGLKFMGKAWDYQVPSVEVWREVYRVLRPGAALLSFGGSRTFHRIAVNVEDAGFELRDSLMWLYAKGFPKSLNVSLALAKAAGPATELANQWDGYGTALKPAHEPIILARKPLDGTVVENVTRWGTGALAIDACRIGRAEGDRTEYGRDSVIPYTGANAYGTRASTTAYTPHNEGRWPANLLLDEEAGTILDEEVGERKSNPYRANEASGNVLSLKKRTAGGRSETGGPSRFFFSSKVSTKEREAGCEALPMRSAGEMTDREEGEAALDCPRTGAGRTGGSRNPHPTLKPISLTKWLAALIKPPTADARLLVPFAGVGSEMIGALLAGWPSVFGIEGDFDGVGYLDIAHARIKYHVGR